MPDPLTPAEFVTAIRDLCSELRALLDRVEESAEGRDWIENPDGTLVYWQQEATDARARVAAALALHTPRRWVQDGLPYQSYCPTCDVPPPCATARALGVES